MSAEIFFFSFCQHLLIKKRTSPSKQFWEDASHFMLQESVDEEEKKKKKIQQHIFLLLIRDRRFLHSLHI